jgi:hypothetical protein
VADGRGQGEVAAEGYHEGVDDDDELHIEDGGAVILAECFLYLLGCLLACFF